MRAAVHKPQRASVLRGMNEAPPLPYPMLQNTPLPR
jgi:hypothetical protein